MLSPTVAMFLLYIGFVFVFIFGVWALNELSTYHLTLLILLLSLWLLPVILPVSLSALQCPPTTFLATSHSLYDSIVKIRPPYQTLAPPYWSDNYTCLGFFH